MTALPMTPPASVVHRSGSRRPLGWSAVTKAERRVVELVAEGFTYGEIGQRLFISRRTVESHVANVFAKVGARSKAGLAAAYVRHGVRADDGDLAFS